MSVLMSSKIIKKNADKNTATLKKLFYLKNLLRLFYYKKNDN